VVSAISPTRDSLTPRNGRRRAVTAAGTGAPARRPARRLLSGNSLGRSPCNLAPSRRWDTNARAFLVWRAAAVQRALWSFGYVHGSSTPSSSPRRVRTYGAEPARLWISPPSRRCAIATRRERSLAASAGRGKASGWISMSGNPNYQYSYSLKTLIWISVVVFVFNMDVRWMYSNPIFNIIRIRNYSNYSTKIRHIRRIRKNKVTIETI
jgi:hypothetical protein